MMWRVALSASIALVLLAILLHGIAHGPTSIVDSPDKEYDYIVVGAGSAGCVIASRLVEDSRAKVLLVEAGETVGFVNRVPLLAPAVQLTDSDWQYRSTPQKYSSKGLIGDVQLLPRGRGLGGTGQINYMFHSFGRPADYTDWLEDWSFPKLEPYFEKVEQLMSVSRRFLSPVLSEAEALYQRAVPGLELSSMTSYEGARASSYRVHLRQAWHKPNLHIMSSALVSKVLIDERNATRGVELVDGSATTRAVAARKEVILCAGAYASPQILMLSGVGPARELRKHGIPVKADLPFVGRNLFDHLNMPLYVGFNNPPKPISITHESLLKPGTFFDYILAGSGLLASNGVVGVARTGDHAVILTALGTIDREVLARLSNYPDSVFESLFPTHSDGKSEGFLLLTTCLQPRSRGRVSLGSARVADHPLIDPNYLSKQEDVDCHVRAMRQAKEMAESPAFAEYAGQLHLPLFHECRHFRQGFDDDDYSTCVLRIAGLTSHHPGGTCRMGSSRTASVVNEKLQVHDIKKLRVVDASILPNPISGPPNSVIIAIAEKAAKMIQGAA